MDLQGFFLASVAPQVAVGLFICAIISGWLLVLLRNKKAKRTFGLYLLTLGVSATWWTAAVLTWMLSWRVAHIILHFPELNSFSAIKIAFRGETVVRYEWQQLVAYLVAVPPAYFMAQMTTVFVNTFVRWRFLRSNNSLRSPEIDGGIGFWEMLATTARDGQMEKAWQP